MKRLTLAFVCMLCMLFTSCETSAQIVVDDSFYATYYDYRTNLPIVYIDSRPYYRVWYNGMWVHRIVPIERYEYIRHYHRPTIHRPPIRDMHRYTTPIPHNHGFQNNIPQRHFNNVPHTRGMNNIPQHSNRGGRR